MLQETSHFSGRFIKEAWHLRNLFVLRRVIDFMPAGLLIEDREEQKYPKWMFYLSILYVIVLLWTVFSLPPTGYYLESMLLIVLLWLPVPIGALYFFEKPASISEHKRAMRIIFTIFAVIAIFWGLALSWAFF